MTTVLPKFFMIASPGERHEDCIPKGLYTLSGFQRLIEKEMKDVEGFQYYIFVMEPDVEVIRIYDCDHVITYDPSDGRGCFYFDDSLHLLSEIMDILSKE